MQPPLSLSLVVAATDFSDGARAGFHTAVDLAARSGAALHLVHAESEGDDRRRYAPDIATTEGALRAWANETVGPKRLDKIRFEPVAIVDEFDPVAALLRYVAKADADLLVAGTHGRRGPRRWLIGSVAERLVRFGPCPVLTVPYRSPGTRRGKAPVLAAVDFSSATPDVLTWAKRLAALFDAPLDLLHVVAEAVPTPHFYPTLQQPPLRSILETAPDLHQRIRDEMEQELLRARGPSVKAWYHVRAGTPSKEIVEFARDHETALIVMGTQGLTGVELFLLGSTAAKTVRSAPCAVLTTRRPEVEDPETGNAVSRAALTRA